MAFKPANASRPQNGEFENTANYPTPRAGSRKARVSLIVDMGTQEREPFEEPDGTIKEQKPCQQVAVFADLVADTVDYGGPIGKQHYRLLLNKSFQGKVQGINFVATPPKDAKGNLIKDKPWGFHPTNLLTKLAKAVGREDVIESMDVEQLLGLPFMAQVEVKETPAKDGKLDKDGNPIIYKNVNFKGAAQVPTQEDDDGNDLGPIPVAELNTEAKCITFDNATKDDIKFIRAGLIKQIKLALNYAGSNMQKAIEAFEAEAGQGKQDDAGEEKPAAASKPSPAKKVAAKTAPKPAKTDTGFDDMDEDLPF